MVDKIIGSEVKPTLPIVARFKPKPSNTTAVCKIFLEVKVIPPWNLFLNAELFLKITVTIIPTMIAITGAPNNFKRRHKLYKKP